MAKTMRRSYRDNFRTKTFQDKDNPSGLFRYRKDRCFYADGMGNVKLGYGESDAIKNGKRLFAKANRNAAKIVIAQQVNEMWEEMEEHQNEVDAAYEAYVAEYEAMTLDALTPDDDDNDGDDYYTPNDRYDREYWEWVEGELWRDMDVDWDY